MSLMTLTECIDALSELINRNIAYVENEARFKFKDHEEARAIVQNARKAWTHMTVVENGGKE